MSRPAGDPAAIAGGSRSLAGAAAALRDVRGRLRGATSFVVVAGAWKGPASEAFLLDGAGTRTGLDRTADGLDQAAAALSELAARLDHAQATWDRAHRLAASAGVDLSRHGDGAPPVLESAWNPRGGVLSPADAVDPAAMLLAGQAIRMAEAAEHEAAAARRAAAARLDQASTQGRVGAAAAGHAGDRAGGPRAGSRNPDAGHGHPPAGAGAGGHGQEEHGGPVRRMVGRVLEAGAEAATATHHLVAAAEARVKAAGRLAMVADDPAVRSAAARVAQGAGRPLIEGGFVGALPLVAPVLDFTAAVSHGEPVPRALAGAVGAAVGADLGGRIGMAACGGEAAVTQGAGLIVCPVLTAAGGALGAHVGKSAALHLYDKVAGPPEGPADPPPAAAAGAEVEPDPDPVTPRPRTKLESNPDPGPRPLSQPWSEPGSGSGPGLASRPDPVPALGAGG